MNMRKNRILNIIVLSVISVMCVSQVGASDKWLTSYEKALKASAKQNKPILADFTGSEWCGWCIKLKKEVFDTPEFKKWAAEKVILLELDYPQAKKQSAELKKQNAMLQKKYAIRGFPTILLLDSKGTKVGRGGYLKGGPVLWTKAMQQEIDRWKKKINKTLFMPLPAALEKSKKTGFPILLALTGDRDLSRKADAVCRNPELQAASIAALFVEVKKKDIRDMVVKAFDKTKLPNSGLALVDFTKGEVLNQFAFDTKPATIVAAIRKASKPVEYDGKWLENMELAKRISFMSGKPMLVDFTGSDWCGWCIKIDKEIFETDKFKAYAKKELVLVKIDFPRKKKLNAALEAQNRELAQKFAVRGFPTILVLNPSGQKIGQTGYIRGGPEPFIKNIKSIIDK